MGTSASKGKGAPGASDGTSMTSQVTESFDEAWAPYLDQTTKGNIWKTYKIISGPQIKKVKAPVGEIWGKYNKIYSKPALGTNPVFNPPLYFSIDNIRVLCPCRDINQRMYDANNDKNSSDLGLMAKIVSRTIIPGCWEDYSSIMRPQGDSTFDVYVNHPAFFEYILSRDGGVGIVKNVFGFLGYSGGKRRTRRKKIQNRKKHTVRANR